MKTHPNLVWIDLEMTGLDPETDSIIEIATIVTDSDLEIIAEGPNLVLHQPPSRFEVMDAWNQNQHTKSGLWQQVIKSEIGLQEAEQTTLNFLIDHTKANESPLCGNSVWQDRRFLRKYMPRLDAHLHYRLVDISSIKELAKRWYEDDKLPQKSKDSHRALEDIKESINELAHYKNTIFIDQ